MHGKALYSVNSQFKEIDSAILHSTLDVFERKAGDEDVPFEKLMERIEEEMQKYVVAGTG